MRVSDSAVRLAVIGKLGWIRRHQARFAAQPRQSAREMVSGESHYYLGRRYRLRVVEHDRAGRVVLRGSTMLELYVPRGTDVEYRTRILLGWYRKRLRELIPPLLAKWEAKLDEQVSHVGIKRMKTKWGSCNADARRIWLNLELAKKPIQCLEYIVVHEMVHFIERHHDGRFTALMDECLPRWRAYRDELNHTPLAHETWDGQRNQSENPGPVTGLGAAPIVLRELGWGRDDEH